MNLYVFYVQPTFVYPGDDPEMGGLPDGPGFWTAHRFESAEEAQTEQAFEAVREAQRGLGGRLGPFQDCDVFYEGPENPWTSVLREIRNRKEDAMWFGPDWKAAPA